jgi:spore coat protein A, manganese oxidase
LGSNSGSRLGFALRALKLATVIVIASISAIACFTEDAKVREELWLPKPPIATPTRSDATGDYFTLTQKEGRQQALPGATLTPVIGYDGRWPGPTIVARRGRPTHLTIQNELNRPTTTHNHGHKVEARSDGHPADFVWPNTSKEYVYPNDQNAGTYWYHDHTMRNTGRNVYWGLAGFYIIKDDFWDALKLPSGEFDVPLLIQDRKFNGVEEKVTSYLGAPRSDPNDTNMSYPAIGTGGFGDTACVNGACAYPGSRGVRMEVAARKYMFRLLNGSDQRTFRIQFRITNPELGRDEGNLPFAVVASDGGLLPFPVAKFTLLLAPAERFAIVFDFTNYPVGTIIEMQNAFNINPPAPQNLPVPNIMEFRIAKEAVDDSTIPTEMLPIERFDPTKADVKRTIVFGRHDGTAVDGLAGGGVSRWTINGREFDPGRIDFRGVLGQTELWEITNETNVEHTIHVHLAQFQVVELDGSRPPNEYLGWKDTLLIPVKGVGGGGSAKIMMRWESFTGVYVFHCHTLIHEDTEMMSQIEIVAPPP